MPNGGSRVRSTASGSAGNLFVEFPVRAESPMAQRRWRMVRAPEGLGRCRCRSRWIPVHRSRRVFLSATSDAARGTNGTLRADYTGGPDFDR